MYFREQRKLFGERGNYNSNKSANIEEIKLDRRIKIMENLSQLKDIQEEREREFKMREREYQQAKKQRHLYQELQERQRAMSYIEEKQNQLYLLERSSKFSQMPESQKLSRILTITKNIPQTNLDKDFKYKNNRFFRLTSIDNDNMVTNKIFIRK